MKMKIVRICISVLLGIALAISISACISPKVEAPDATRTTGANYTPNEAATFDNIVVNGESLYIGLKLNDMIAEGVTIGDLEATSIAMPEFKKMIDVEFRGVPLQMLIENSGTDGISLGETQVVQIHVKESNLTDEDTVIISTVDIRTSMSDVEKKLGKPDSVLCGDNFNTDSWKKEIEGKNIIAELYFTQDSQEGVHSATLLVQNNSD